MATLWQKCRLALDSASSLTIRLARFSSLKSASCAQTAWIASIEQMLFSLFSHARLPTYSLQRWALVNSHAANPSKSSSISSWSKPSGMCGRTMLMRCRCSTQAHQLLRQISHEPVNAATWVPLTMVRTRWPDTSSTTSRTATTLTASICHKETSRRSRKWTLVVRYFHPLK